MRCEPASWIGGLQAEASAETAAFTNRSSAWKTANYFCVGTNPGTSEGRRPSPAIRRASFQSTSLTSKRMDRSRLLHSPIAVATVGDADAHAVAAAAGELHGFERTSIGSRSQRRASSPAYRMMDRVVVADRRVDSLVESQLSAISSW
jgi:hypothetical protein